MEKQDSLLVGLIPWARYVMNSPFSCQIFGSCLNMANSTRFGKLFAQFIVIVEKTALCKYVLITFLSFLHSSLILSFKIIYVSC